MLWFRGDDPTKMYFDSLVCVMREGHKSSPRGKLISEIRPVCFEFMNPRSRVTFLGGRKINPFFQVAESLWILSGKSDVKWLEHFNSTIGQFSDDGKYFNAAYGERIRHWNKNELKGVIINPVDQLADVYRKITSDPDTRQAVIVISNPMFDNSKYTIDEHGLDIACNLVITFKVRDNKLDMTVFNRSNDLHWGLFGANLCQFSTIQEVLTNWLKKSGVAELSNVEVGTYNHITDSLHVYLDSYGSKCTEDVLKYYMVDLVGLLDPEFDEHSTFEYVDKLEPKMSMSKEEFDEFLDLYWNDINQYIMDDDKILDTYRLKMKIRNIDDDYWRFVVNSMVVYRFVKLGKFTTAMYDFMSHLPVCQWSISMLYFLKTFVKNRENRTDYYEWSTSYKEVLNKYVVSLSEKGFGRLSALLTNYCEEN